MASKYAIIETGGKQYKVSVGSHIFIEKIDGKLNSQIDFKRVLLTDNKIGSPYITGASVIGLIEKQSKQKKVITFKYKPKKHGHVKKGHRQPYTKVLIKNIKLS